MTFLKLDRMVVGHGRMRLCLSWHPETPVETTPSLIDAVLHRYPAIVAHSCINSYGPTFGDAIYGTNIAHLLEHLVIEMQHEELLRAHPELDSDPMRLNRSSDQTRLMFVGTTEIRHDLCKAVVEVSFVDDLVCARCAMSALALIEDELSRETLIS